MRNFSKTIDHLLSCLGTEIYLKIYLLFICCITQCFAQIMKYNSDDDKIFLFLCKLFVLNQNFTTYLVKLL